MTRLPDDWSKSRLGAIAETQLGKMLNRSKQTGRSTVPYLRSLNVQWGQINTGDLNSMDIESNEREKFTVKKGDLLVCEGGESGRAAIWNGEEPIGFQNALHRIRPSDKIESRYLLYYFEWLVKNGLINHLFNGVTIKHFPQENLRSVEISYPAIAEQHQIVEILEDHLSRLDAALADMRQARTRAAQFRRSFIHKLTSEINGMKRLPLLEVCDVYQPRTISTKELIRDGAFPVFGANGQIGFYDKYNHEEIEVTVTCRGATCGTVNVIPARSWITGNAMVFHPKDNQIQKGFLEFVLRGFDFSRIITGTAQPQITRASLADVTLPVPDEQAQIEIEQTLRSSLSRVDHSVDISIEIETQMTNFRRSLLQAAFTGQLTREATHV